MKFFTRRMAWLPMLCCLLALPPANATDSVIGSGVNRTDPVDLTVDGDTLTIDEGGTLNVTSGDYAVRAENVDGFQITNDGSIIYSSSVFGAIYANTSTDGFIYNGAGGSIESSNWAINLQNSISTIVNEGAIYGQQAIYALGSTVNLTNSDTITGSFIGLNLDTSTADVLINTGAITGMNFYAIQIIDSTVSYFSNQNTIVGLEQGLHLHNSSLTGINSGKIIGDIAVKVHESATLDLVNSGLIIGGTTGIEIADTGTRATILNKGAIYGGSASIVVEQADLDLVNSGVIQGGTRGIDVDEGSTATILNKGNIYGGVNGIDVNQGSTATILNKGNIYGGGNGIGGDNGSLYLINAGVIEGGSSAINIDSNEDITIELLPGSVLIGDIYLANSNFIFGNGLNALLSFKPGSSLPTSIDTNGMPSVVDSDDMQIAVADTTGFAMADETLGDLTQSVMDAVSRRLHTEESTAARYARLATGEIVSPAGRDLSTSDVVWGEALGAWREQEASSPVWSSDHHLTGIVSGFDGVLSEAYHAGIFLGAAQSQLAVDDNAQEIDTQSLFGGMYVSRRAGPVISDLTILAGWQENDSERLIANNTAATGVEVAEASYDGIFLAPQVTLGMEFPAVTPSLTLGYAGLFLEEYEEQGSTAALTVDSRSVHSLLSRAQLALPRHYELADGRSLSIEHRIGIEGRYSFGSDVSATLLAQSITFEPGGNDLVANLFAGSDVALRSITGRSALRLGVLASAGSDGSLVLSSGLGGEFLF